MNNRSDHQVAFYLLARSFKTSLEDQYGMGKGKHRPTLYWKPEWAGRVEELKNDGLLEKVDAIVPNRGGKYYYLREDGRRFPLSLKHGHVYLFLSLETEPVKLVEAVIEEVYEKHLEKIDRVLVKEGKKDIKAVLDLARRKDVSNSLYEKIERLCDGRIESWLKALDTRYRELHKIMPQEIRMKRLSVTREACRRLKSGNRKRRDRYLKQEPRLRKKLADLEITIARMQKKNTVDLILLEADAKEIKKTLDQIEREPRVAELSEKLCEEFLNELEKNKEGE